MKISSKATYVLLLIYSVLDCPSTLAKHGNNEKQEDANAIDTSNKNKDRELGNFYCKGDDVEWVSTGTKYPKNCGHVWMQPERFCTGKRALSSAEGVPASEACPVACGDLRTKTCDMPKCSEDDSWFKWLPKYGGRMNVCNDYLHQHVRGTLH